MTVAYESMNSVLCGTCGSGLTVQATNAPSQYTVWCTDPDCPQNGVKYTANAPTINLTMPSQ